MIYTLLGFFLLFTSESIAQQMLGCRDMICRNGGRPYGLNICLCRGGYTGGCCETDINECSSLPCQNQGLCVDQVNSYQCRCKAGYTGKNCEIDIDECASSPCQHGSSCTDHLNSFTCSCPLGYTGQYCQINLDDCMNNHCQHNGTCIDHDGFYTCVCQSGFTGRDCETNVQCHSNPCMNNAVCTDDQDDGYTCHCSPGFTGHHCEIDTDDCARNPCKHQSTCVDKVNFYTCVCPPGYTDRNCQTNIQCHSQPCMHDGICTDDQESGFTCHCLHGYTGHTCEKEPPITTAPVVKLDRVKTIFEGSTHEFVSCIADGIPDPDITWEALNGMLPPNARQITHYLYFENVTLADEGNYVCSARNIKGMDVKVTHIVVEAKAEKQHTAPVINAPSVVVAKYYANTTLTCNVTGYPTPTVTWKHNNVVVSTGSTLVIQGVTNATSGYYTCIATNDAGVSRAKINVIFSFDAPKIISPPSSAIILAGQSHNFTCLANGHPEPTIIWHFKPFISPESVFPPHLIAQKGSVLRMINMKISGILTCTAHNDYGVDTASVDIIVRNGPPRIIQSTNANPAIG